MQSNNDIKMINENKKISIEDFTLITVLGKGSYAKVILVRKKDNNKIYAMKVIKKKTNNGQK
jgi:serum/glucocorticoid-regulated kinase 2